MKYKKIIAAVLGTALALSTVAGLAACGNGSKNGKPLGTTTLNIADYATDYATLNESTATEIKYSGTKLLDFDPNAAYMTLGSGSIYVYRIVNTSGFYTSYVYDAYSVIAERKIATGLYTQPQVVNWNTSVNALRCTYYDEAFDEYRTSADGSIINCYLGGETKVSQVLKVDGYSYDDDGKSTTVTNYFKTEYDAKSRSYELTKISESSIRLFDSNEYGSGESLSALNSIYPQDENKPVEGAIADYEYVNIGNIYTFYKDGTATGNVSVEGGDAIGFIGNYFYYCTYKSVSPDATSGYNVLVVDGEEKVKQQYTLHKYDIIKNKTTDLNYNVVVTSITPLYNYAKKAYDAAAVVCGKMTDGVLYIGYGDIITAAYATDSDLRVAYDVTGYMSTFDDVYKLKEDRYAVGGYVVDGNFNFVHQYTLTGNGNLYADQGLISFNVNGYYGFTDLDGKIIYEPRYKANSGAIKFNGGYACVYERQNNGTNKLAIIDGKGGVKYIEGASVNTYADFYTVYDKVGNNNYSFGVYNLDGSTIREFKNLDPENGDSIGVQAIGGCYCIIYNDDIYKLA